MNTKILVLAMMTIPLAGCQTIDQAGESEARIVCTNNGYGPGNKYYEGCIRDLKPMAVRLEQRRRAEKFSQGIVQIARGLNPPTAQPKLTCVQTGNVTRCY